MVGQSVSSGVIARAWLAAMAAWSAYGPGGRPARGGQVSRDGEGREASADEKLVPAATVLVAEQYDAAVRRRARGEARGLDFEERRESVDFGLPGIEGTEDAGEADRFVAEGGAGQPPRGRRVALIENQVDDFED